MPVKYYLNRAKISLSFIKINKTNFISTHQMNKKISALCLVGLIGKVQSDIIEPYNPKLKSVASSND